MKNFETKKRELVKKILHLDTLMEVSEGYPQHGKYANELEVIAFELHDLILKNKSKKKPVLTRMLEFFHQK